MKNNIIKTKSFAFALKTVEVVRYLIEQKKEFVLSKQILRSGTAIGALVWEAEHAESKMDFIHKLAIAQKETNETDYWIELLFQSKLISEQMYQSIANEVKELGRILSSIIITSKNKKLKTP